MRKPCYGLKIKENSTKYLAFTSVFFLKSNRSGNQRQIFDR